MIDWTNVTIKLSTLKPWEHNPRTMTKAQAKRLLKSWNELGQFQTIAIGPSGDVYDGHQRLSALLTAHGATYQIEARQSDRALTDEERQALTLAANIGAGQWNWDALAAWDVTTLTDWGMDSDTLKTWQSDVSNLGTMLGVETVAPDFAEYDESVADGVSVCKCPECGHEHAKKD